MNRLEEIAVRKAEIKALLTSDAECNLEEVRAEIDALEEEERSIRTALAESEKEAEARREVADEINEGNLKAIEIKEERKTMENVELRNTAEYGKAFVKTIIKGDDSELRALLSENASGSVPVPAMLENEIKNAWEESRFMSLVKRTTFRGNVKVGFEVSSTGASVHVEGTEAPNEETLVWGTVELKAEAIKKWLTVSDIAIESTTLDTLGEIYKEIAQKIVETAEDEAIKKIIASPTTSSATAPAVPVLTANAPAEDTIISAEGLLGGKARDLYLIMNRQTYAMFKGISAKAKYNVDVFDGIDKDHILFTDALKPFSTASVGDTYAIVGDLGYGFQANFPSGNDMDVIVDPYSLAEKDLVKIVGKQLVGMGVVAPKSFTKIVK